MAMKDIEESKESKLNLNKVYGAGGEAMSEDSVVCKKCSRSFMSLADICYLQECLHPVCKVDLKNLIFQ